jgi:NTP pyrophosphatase (non-canonical NTP hydrolase)
MSLTKIQNDIHQFSEERGWNKMTSTIFNMLCNISEESGEVWSVIKWIGNDDDMKTVIEKNHAELSDGIGDLLWCVLRLANLFGVDSEKAIVDTLNEYIQRFPIEKVKGKKSNPTLGGFDGKYSNV